MNLRKLALFGLIISLAGASWSLRGETQGSPSTAPASPAPASKPSDAEVMAQMTALGQPGEHHRLLAQLVGTWAYTLKFGMAPGAPLTEAGAGKAVRTAIMGGRYFVVDVTGKMLMPGPDGKMMHLDFKAMSIEAYDNVKQKFVSSWIDNTGTSIVLSEGTYDDATKSFTYQFEMEVLPGMKTREREVVTVLDADHYRLEWYEIQRGHEDKTMEIAYTRQK